MRNGNGRCVPRMFASYCCLISSGTRKQDLLCQIMSEPGRALMWTAGIPALRQKLPLQSLGNESKGQKHSFCGMWYYVFPLVRLWLIGSVVWPNYSKNMCLFSSIPGQGMGRRALFTEETTYGQMYPTGNTKKNQGEINSAEHSLTFLIMTKGALSCPHSDKDNHTVTLRIFCSACQRGFKRFRDSRLKDKEVALWCCLWCHHPIPVPIRVLVALLLF